MKDSDNGREGAVDISVITVCFNAGALIEKTIGSFLTQEGLNRRFTAEYIVVDGASTDDTLAWVERHAADFDALGVRLTVISEKDDGIYDAMNKGIRRARGEWVYLLNAGDRLFADNVLLDAAEWMQSDADVLYGGYYRVNGFHDEMVVPPPIEQLRRTMILCHQAVFVRRRVNVLHPYDIRYRLAADYHLMLSLYLGGCDFRVLPFCVAVYDAKGLSAERMVDTYREIDRARRELGVAGGGLGERVRFAAGIWKRRILSRTPNRVRGWLVRIRRVAAPKALAGAPTTPRIDNMDARSLK